MSELMEEIKELFEDFEEDELLDKVKEAVEAGETPLDIIGVMTGCLEDIGEQFSKGELFLPHMVMAGDQMEQCMDYLEPILADQSESLGKKVRIVLGTVSGDVHSIGKNTVKTMLTVSGFDVVDLGEDVSPEQFYKAVTTEKADALALSSCMTTTIPSMKDTIDLFTGKGLIDKIPIVIGGGSMTRERAEQHPGCVYGGKDAFECAQVFKTIFAQA